MRVLIPAMLSLAGLVLVIVGQGLKHGWLG